MTDAGGNDLLKVDHKGRISVVAVFPTQPVEAPPDIPDLPPAIDAQAVPTSVVKGPDGAFYVGQLTGFPFPPGGASVFRVVPGHDPEVFAGGFTNIIDIAFDKRGRLYVLEIATGGLLNTPRGPAPGRPARPGQPGRQPDHAGQRGPERPGRVRARARRRLHHQQQHPVGRRAGREGRHLATREDHGPGRQHRPGPSRSRTAHSTEMCTWSSWRRVGLQLQGSEGWR